MVLQGSLVFCVRDLGRRQLTFSRFYLSSCLSNSMAVVVEPFLDLAFETTLLRQIYKSKVNISQVLIPF